MTCAFWSDQPFNLSFCSNSSWIPWFDCSVEWPWPETKVKPGRAKKQQAGAGGLGTAAKLDSKAAANAARIARLARGGKGS